MMRSNNPPLDSLLATAREYNASDLHIIAGMPPAFRVNGEIILAESDVLSENDADEMAFALLTELQRSKLEREWELCISLRHPAAGRATDAATTAEARGRGQRGARGRSADCRDPGAPGRIDSPARRCRAQRILSKDN